MKTINIKGRKLGDIRVRIGQRHYPRIDTHPTPSSCGCSATVTAERWREQGPKTSHESAAPTEVTLIEMVRKIWESHSRAVGIAEGHRDGICGARVSVVLIIAPNFCESLFRRKFGVNGVIALVDMKRGVWSGCAWSLFFEQCWRWWGTGGVHCQCSESALP